MAIFLLGRMSDFFIKDSLAFTDFLFRGPILLVLIKLRPTEEGSTPWGDPRERLIDNFSFSIVGLLEDFEITFVNY